MTKIFTLLAVGLCSVPLAQAQDIFSELRLLSEPLFPGKISMISETVTDVSATWPLYETAEGANFRVVAYTPGRTQEVALPVTQTWQALPSTALQVQLSRCVNQSPNKQGAAAFVSVAGAASQTLFSGWMFADAPHASTLNHRQFGLLFLNCE